MTPDELDRELARLATLAKEARQRLDQLSQSVHAVRVLIDDTAASSSAADDAAPEGADARGKDRTTAAEVAQVEAVSK